MRLRWNTACVGGGGSGDALRTASSIERITASSPLQRADLRVDHVAARDLHDVHDALEPRLRAERLVPVALDLVRDQPDVLILQAGRDGRVLLRLGRELLLELRLRLRALARERGLALLARGLLAVALLLLRASLARRAPASRFAASRLRVFRLFRDALALGLLFALLLGDALALALVGGLLVAALLLDSLARLALLALLALLLRRAPPARGAAAPS